MFRKGLHGSGQWAVSLRRNIGWLAGHRFPTGVSIHSGGEISGLPQEMRFWTTAGCRNSPCDRRERQTGRNQLAILVSLSAPVWTELESVAAPHAAFIAAPSLCNFLYRGKKKKEKLWPPPVPDVTATAQESSAMENKIPACCWCPFRGQFA
jgi:hypothetical protein